MKANCPKSGDHKRFYTTVLVAEEWTVDEDGVLLDEAQFLRIEQGPDPKRIWVCAECGEFAVVKN